jgi:hypothetical protein
MGRGGLIFEGPHTNKKNRGPDFSIMGYLTFKKYANTRVGVSSLANSKVLSAMGICASGVLFQFLWKLCLSRQPSTGSMQQHEGATWKPLYSIEKPY